MKFECLPYMNLGLRYLYLKCDHFVRTCVQASPTRLYAPLMYFRKSGTQYLSVCIRYSLFCVKRPICKDTTEQWLNTRPQTNAHKPVVTREVSLSRKTITEHNILSVDGIIKNFEHETRSRSYLWKDLFIHGGIVVSGRRF